MDKQELINAVDSWSNSFLRPLVPPSLLSNSTFKRTEDDGAKLIYAKFLYGERIGKWVEEAFDGNYGNVIKDINEESLWLYSQATEKIPDGFESKTLDGGKIRTGKVAKCGTCRGHGKVTCKTCGGKVRWTEKTYDDKIVEKVCSCGDGKQLCSNCNGYGDVETVIHTEKSFRIYETKNAQYKGEVPADKIKKITGNKIFEEIIDYPLEDVKEMLTGGIHAAEFDSLNQTVLQLLHDKVEKGLSNKAVNTKFIHEQIDELFKTVPNPCKENKVLEKEVMPVRVMVSVEDAPVTQVDYNYKETDYSIWIFGNENSVWYESIPSSFNYKVIVILVAVLAIAGLIIFNSI